LESRCLFCHNRGMTVDTRWFMDAIHARGMSLRGLAREMKVEPSTLSRSFRGQRRIQLADAQILARKLQQPVTEVLRAAGLDGIESPEPLPEQIVVTALVQPDGTLQMLHAPRAIDRPAVVPVAGAALMRNTGWIDGALVTLGASTPLQDAIDRTGVATLKGGTQVIGVVRRAFAGKLDLETLDRRLEDVTITDFHPVLSIHPR
jgi:transcriptional regulator with XRE-family HTH domain